MKQKTIGIYSDGVDYYKLILTEGDNACAYHNDAENNTHRLSIGSDVEHDYELYGDLEHELGEIIRGKMGLHYKPSDQQVDFGGPSLFVYSHAEYSEICARVGRFMVKAWPDALKAWKEWRKK